MNDNKLESRKQNFQKCKILFKTILGNFNLLENRLNFQMGLRKKHIEEIISKRRYQRMAVEKTSLFEVNIDSLQIDLSQLPKKISSIVKLN